MGMYTELVIKADVKPNIPTIVESVLHYLFNNGDKPEIYPEHKFFTCDRWDMIGSCSSHYHIPWATSKYHNGYLFSRSDIKNYAEEIELFIDWIKPYLDEEEGKCIGWSWYEEDNEPELLYMGEQL